MYAVVSDYGPWRRVAGPQGPSRRAVLSHLRRGVDDPQLHYCGPRARALVPSCVSIHEITSHLRLLRPVVMATLARCRCVRGCGVGGGRLCHCVWLFFQPPLPCCARQASNELVRRTSSLSTEEYCNFLRMRSIAGCCS